MIVVVEEQSGEDLVFDVFVFILHVF